MPAGDLITKNGQYEFNGLLMNDGAFPVGIMVEKVTGLYELPPFKSTGDSESPDTHGGKTGRDLLSKRIIVMDLAVYSDTDAEMNAKLRAIAGVFQPQDALLPFVYQKAGLGKLRLEARPRRLGGFDSNYDQAMGLSKGSVMLVADDPRIYDFLETAVNIVIPANQLGPISGNVNMIGNFKGGAYPVLTITGPVTNPRIQNMGDGGKTIRIDIVVPAGQALVIDTQKRTILLNGVDEYDTKRSDNEWWVLRPGVNEVKFSRSNNVANQGTLEVRYRSAYV